MGETGTLPVFEESSSPELDGLLQLAREKIIPIAALNEAQKKYIFTPANRTVLENEPLHIEFANDESVQLEYINPLTDLPGKFRLFNHATALASTKADWQNIAKLLRGIAQSGRLQVRLQERFIRHGLSAGFPAVVLATVDAVESSKISLREGENLLYLLSGLRAHYFWSEEEANEASAYIVSAYTRVMNMLEHRKHCGGRKLTEGDLRRQPWVLAPLVEALGLRVKAGWDKLEDSALALNAARLIDMLDGDAIQQATALPVSFEDSIHSATLTLDIKNQDLSIPKNRAVLRRLLMRWEPVHSALQLLQELKPSNVPLGAVPGILETLSANLDNALSAYKNATPNVVERDAPASWLSPELVRWSRFSSPAPVRSTQAAKDATSDVDGFRAEPLSDEVLGFAEEEAPAEKVESKKSKKGKKGKKGKRNH